MNQALKLIYRVGDIVLDNNLGLNLYVMPIICHVIVISNDEIERSERWLVINFG